MPTMSLRVDDETKNWLDIVAEKHNLNASAVVRDAINEKLTEMDRGTKPRSKLPLSTTERLILSNQFRLLEILDPENASHHSRKARIVEEGYELNYGWMTDHLYEGLSREECIRVLEILDMYSSLLFSFGAAKDDTGLDRASVEFFGFDGNHESELKQYAQFLIYEEHKFEILQNESGHVLNSHFPSIAIHMQRLSRWKSKGQPYSMDITTIRWILDELT